MGTRRTANQPHKRPNGAGSVFWSKGEERWIVTLTISGGPTRRRIKRIARSEEDGYAILQELLALRDGGLLTVAGTMPLGQFLMEWLEYEKRQDVRPTTYDHMRINFRHVSRHLGQLQLYKLTAPHIRRLYRDLGERLSARSIGVIHVNLKDALNFAVAEGAIPLNPVAAVKPPRWEEPEQTLLSPAQLGQLLDAMTESNHRLAPMAILIGLTGLRHGEALGLHWNDIDWERQTLTVQRTWFRSRAAGIDFGPPKTKASHRTIRLPQIAADALRAHKVRQAEEILAAAAWWDEKRELVFTTPKGRPMQAQHLLRAVQSHCADLGLPPITVHQLRHSVATIMGREHVQPHTMQKHLGHARVQTTLSIYAHVLQTMEDEAVDLVSHAVFQRP